MVLDREEIFRVLRRYRGYLRRLGVRRIGLFGSFVRGEAGKDSDIDFIVVFEEGRKSYDSFFRLVVFLEGVFGRRVEVLTPEGISRYLKPYIEREVVYEEL